MHGHHLPYFAFENGHSPTWCPGCGNLAIWSALKEALAKTKRQPSDTVIVFDIGCHGNGGNWYRAYAFHGLHGRALPLGVGVSLARHDLKTIVISGDGGAYGEGAGHFLHTIRANPNLTLIVDDNQIYGLTKGQASPTSLHGAKTDSTPSGLIDDPINPLTVALSAGCGFVARGFAGDLPHLTTVLTAALEYRGFSYVDVFQPCVSFNHVNTYAWFYERVVKLDTLCHDPADRAAAWQRASETERLPIGVFYAVERPTYQDQLGVLKDGPLASRPLTPPDIGPLIKEFL